AAGAGKEAGPADEGERSRLRRQALGWLGAQLADWQKGIRSAPPAAQSSARRELWLWRHQGALAPLPEADRPPNLPPPGQPPCRPKSSSPGGNSGTASVRCRRT